MTATRADRNWVIDASVVVRAVTSASSGSRRWLDEARDGEWSLRAPDLLWAETANALLRYADAGVMGAAEAASALEVARNLPIADRPVRVLAHAALRIGLKRKLTAYDAAYVALAEAEDVPLATADARVAAATPRSLLLA